MKMKIEYELDNDGIWYAITTLEDAGWGAITLVMNLDGADGFNMYAFSDHEKLKFDLMSYEKVQNFVSEASEELEELEGGLEDE
jgi:hypothetical protein